MSRIGITGLGLVASGRRNILPGYEFEKLYAKSELLGNNPIIGGDHSDTYDTLNHMAKIVRDTLNDTKKVAPTLIGRSLEETLRNNWNHVYKHFQYKKDAQGIEQVRRPARSWVDRKEGIDCDCMTVLLSSLLHWQKISHTFRKAQYNAETGWQHVYVVVPKNGVSIDAFDKYNQVDRNKYYVLDCVVDKFNYEVPFIKKFDKLMKIQYLNGLDQATLNGGVTSQLANGFNPMSTAELLAGFGCEFDGLDGFGDALQPMQLQSMFLRGLRQHLVNSRQIIALNPALTAGLYEPALFVQRLDALIASFDNGTLGTTLRELANMEDRDGLGGHGPLGNIFKKIASGVKKVAQKVASTVKTVATNIKKTAPIVVQKIKEDIKSVAKFVVRYNPLTIAVRNGLLLAMKINLFRMAEKLGYGYWTEAQAAQAGLDIAEWKKAKDKLDKVRNIHKKIGGKLDKLDNAIKKGWQHGVEKHKLPTLKSSAATGTTTSSTTDLTTGAVTAFNVNVTDSFGNTFQIKTPADKNGNYNIFINGRHYGQATKLINRSGSVYAVTKSNEIYRYNVPIGGKPDWVRVTTIPAAAKGTTTVTAAPKPAVKTTSVPSYLSTTRSVGIQKPALQNARLSGFGEVEIASTRIKAVVPLLQLVNEQLNKLQFKSLLRKPETTELERFFQAVRTNKGGIATKLSLAYKPVDVANQYSKADYAKLLQVAQFAESLVTQRGGTTQQLRDAVNAGKAVALSQENLGEAATAGTAAASTVLATIGALLSQVDFKKMFKGKADSPASSTDKHVTAPVDEDTFDEGDPTTSVSSNFNLTDVINSVVPKVQSAVSTVKTTPLVQTVQKAVQNAIPQATQVVNQAKSAISQSNLVSTLTKSNLVNTVKNLVTTPTVSLVKSVQPTEAKQVAQVLTPTQALTLKAQIATKPELKETPLAKEVAKVVANPPIQQAQVIESKPLPKDDNTVKYVVIGTGAALVLATAGYFILRGKSSGQVRSLGNTEPEPTPEPTPTPLSGVKKVKSQRTRKVMAITI